MQVTVDLREGFLDDEVVISEGQKELFRAHGITTRSLSGSARFVRLTLEAGSKTLRIAVPTRALERDLTIDLSAPLFLGVSISPKDTLELRVSRVPFGYIGSRKVKK